jgi:hypothetical protein
MRYHFFGRVRDSAGNVQPNVSVYVYLTGTTSAATIYRTYSGGTAITTAPQFFSDADGYFNFYVDDAIYPVTQLFDIIVGGVTYDKVNIIGGGTSGGGGTGGSGTSGTSGTSGESGSSGTSGTSFYGTTSGSSGTSGFGTSGTSGTSGESGSSGTSGTSGESGTSGTSGSSGLGYYTTSGSNILMDTGEISFSVSSNLAYVAGDRVRIIADINNYMEGLVTFYDGNEITVDIDLIIGSGLYSTWVFSLTGYSGSSGTSGFGTSGTSGSSGTSGTSFYGVTSGTSG